MAKCENKTCSGKAGDWKLACLASRCEFVTCIKCFDNPSGLMPKHCSKCGSPTDYGRMPTKSYDVIKAKYPNAGILMAVALIQQDAANARDPTYVAPPKPSTDGSVPTREEYMMKDYSISATQWSALVDEDNESGYLSPYSQAHKKPNAFHIAPVSIEPVKGATNPLVDPPDSMKSRRVEGSFGGQGFWAPQGSVDLNLFPHHLISWHNRGEAVFYDTNLQPVATTAFKGVMGLAVNPSAQVYAISHEGKNPDGTSGIVTSITSFADPATPLAVIDVSSPTVVSADGFNFKNQYNPSPMAFLDKSSGGFFVQAERHTKFNKSSGMDIPICFLSVYDVFTGERVHQLGAQVHRFYASEPHWDLLEPHSIHPDPIRPGLFYTVTSRLGISLYDIRVNTQRAIRHVSSSLQESGDERVQMVVPDFGSVNTIITRNTNSLHLYDINMCKFRSRSSKDDMGISSLRSMSYYGKQLVVARDSGLSFLDFDVPEFGKAYFHTEFGQTAYPDHTFWNNNGIFSCTSADIYYGKNFPTSTPMVETAAPKASAAPKGIAVGPAGAPKGIGAPRGIGAPGAAPKAVTSFSKPFPYPIIPFTPPKELENVKAFEYVSGAKVFWGPSGNEDVSKVPFAWFSASPTAILTYGWEGEVLKTYPLETDNLINCSVSIEAGVAVFLMKSRGIGSVEIRSLENLGQVKTKVDLTGLNAEKVAIVASLGKFAVFGRPSYLFDLTTGRRLSEITLKHITAILSEPYLKVYADRTRPIVYACDRSQIFIYDFAVDLAKPVRAISLDPGNELLDLAYSTFGNCDLIGVSAEKVVVIYNAVTGAKVGETKLPYSTGQLSSVGSYLIASDAPLGLCPANNRLHFIDFANPAQPALSANLAGAYPNSSASFILANSRMVMWLDSKLFIAKIAAATIVAPAVNIGQVHPTPAPIDNQAPLQAPPHGHPQANPQYYPQAAPYQAPAASYPASYGDPQPFSYPQHGAYPAHQGYPPQQGYGQAGPSPQVPIQYGYDQGAYQQPHGQQYPQQGSQPAYGYQQQPYDPQYPHQGSHPPAYGYPNQPAPHY